VLCPHIFSVSSDSNHSRPVLYCALLLIALQLVAGSNHFHDMGRRIFSSLIINIMAVIGLPFWGSAMGQAPRTGENKVKVKVKLSLCSP
jgi:hypothetical protein